MRAEEAPSGQGPDRPAGLPAWSDTGFPIRATPFLVTLYGDVAAIRGGELWTGNIVQILGEIGIAESRVRTALSRLVASGRLEGGKQGRRSFYRLTPAAERELAVSARLIYAPVEPPPLRGWHLVLLPETGREAAAATLGRLRFGIAAPRLAVLPDRGAPLPPLPGCRFHALTEDDLAQPLAGVWPLPALAGRMQDFIDRFGGLLACFDQQPQSALALRLLLVHGFREIALRDPLLPPALLPGGWPGAAARGLFVRLYMALMPAADACIARLEGREGRLRADPERLAQRFADLTGVPLTPRSAGA